MPARQWVTIVHSLSILDICYEPLVCECIITILAHLKYCFSPAFAIKLCFFIVFCFDASWERFCH